MFRPVRWPLISCCLLGALLVTGCDKLRPSATDERREANFQNAFNLQIQGLHDDALKAFNRALEANPQNASAHRELGQLYLDKKHDFAVAVYHLRRYQQIKAARNERDANDYLVEQQIKQAQILLAAEFTNQIGQRQNQSQLDDLKRRNAELEATIARLSQQLGLTTQTPPNLPGTAAQSQPQPAADSVRRPGAAAPQATVQQPPAGRTAPIKTDATTPKPAAAPRTHIVKAGEIPAAIARRHGVTVPQLLAANPGVDPRRLRVGQTLKLPESAR